MRHQIWLSMYHRFHFHATPIMSSSNVYAAECLRRCFSFLCRFMFVTATVVCHAVARQPFDAASLIKPHLPPPRRLPPRCRRHQSSPKPFEPVFAQVVVSRRRLCFSVCRHVTTPMFSGLASKSSFCYFMFFFVVFPRGKEVLPAFIQALIARPMARYHRRSSCSAFSARLRDSTKQPACSVGQACLLFLIKLSICCLLQQPSSFRPFCRHFQVLVIGSPLPPHRHEVSL